MLNSETVQSYKFYYVASTSSVQAKKNAILKFMAGGGCGENYLGENGCQKRFPALGMLGIDKCSNLYSWNLLGWSCKNDHRQQNKKGLQKTRNSGAPMLHPMTRMEVIEHKKAQKKGSSIAPSTK